jgi:ElaB/YqjD/DUF883 family membrane-anchored ribosome-binding protein
MSGITRLLAKELSSALGITDNPKFNPMFKQTDEVMADVADPRDPTVARFYSPLESALDEAPIGKEGTRGENVEAFVRKRAPKITKGEMEFRGLGLEPSELYTAESAKESLGALEVKAIKKGSRYRNMQRQDSLQDKEINYAELGLDAADDLGYTTHFGASNLAHARYSVREPSVLKEDENSLYILIEELQSDPLQNVVDDVASYTKKTSEEMDSEVAEVLDQLEFIIESEGSGFPDKAIKDLKSYIYDTVIPTRKNKTLTDSQKKDIFKEALDNIGVKPNIITPQGSLSHVASEIAGREFEFFGDVYLPDLSDRLYEAVETGLGKMETVTTKKDLPVQGITDSIRISLQAIIADAKAKGINEIVLPPVEKLAEKRFSSDEVASKITKGSAFYNTYVAAYQKVLKQLKAELGKQVKIGKKPLNYTVFDEGYRRSTETVQGTLLDISNLTMDPKNTKLRFNTGGLVQRRTK